MHAGVAGSFRTLVQAGMTSSTGPTATPHRPPSSSCPVRSCRRRCRRRARRCRPARRARRCRRARRSAWGSRVGRGVVARLPRRLRGDLGCPRGARRPGRLGRVVRLRGLLRVVGSAPADGGSRAVIRLGRVGSSVGASLGRRDVDGLADGLGRRWRDRLGDGLTATDGAGTGDGLAIAAAGRRRRPADALHDLDDPHGPCHPGDAQRAHGEHHEAERLGPDERREAAPAERDARHLPEGIAGSA